jgi:hypothetical protein
MGLFGPKWWHHHGIKMQVKGVEPGKCLLLSSSAALVRIMAKESGYWMVRWGVRHSHTERTDGQVRFSSDDVHVAFGLAEMPSEPSNFLFEEYDAHVARQGKFIRTQDHLNIPCPGTGHDGDPNVSIEITPELTKAIRQLLGDS